MKNILYYFYQLIIQNIHRVHENYWFEVDDFQYLFTPLTVSPEEINTIYLLLLENKIIARSFHSIVLNKMNQIVTSFEQKNYVLLRLNFKHNFPVDFSKLTVYQYIKMDKKYYPITRDYWLQLWKNKIDYLENELDQVDYKHPLLLESSAYYIGLGENAISYLYHVITNAKKDSRDHVVVSHRSSHAFSSMLEYGNPLYIVLDHYTRDIADYIKYIFWSDTYQTGQIKQYLDSLSLSDYGAGLLISRLLFPSIYFDLCLNILSGDVEQNDILPFITRTKEYEIFFREIYEALNQKNQLEPIDWLVNPSMPVAIT